MSRTIPAIMAKTKFKGRIADDAEVIKLTRRFMKEHKSLIDLLGKI